MRTIHWRGFVMSYDVARQQFYDDMDRFFASHTGADRLSFRYLGLARRICDHFQCRETEELFFDELEVWVEEQLKTRPVAHPILHLRCYGDAPHYSAAH